MGNTNRVKDLSKIKWKSYLRHMNKSKESIILVNNKNIIVFANKLAMKMLDLHKKNFNKVTGLDISPLRQDHLEIDSESAAQEILNGLFESETGKVDFIWQMKSLSGKLFYCRCYMSMIKIQNALTCQIILREVQNLDSENTSPPSSLGSDDEISTATSLSRSQYTTQTEIKEEKEKENIIQQQTFPKDKLYLNQEYLNFQKQIMETLTELNNKTIEKKISNILESFHGKFSLCFSEHVEKTKKLSQGKQTNLEEFKLKYNALESNMEKQLQKIKKLKKSKKELKSEVNILKQINQEHAKQEQEKIKYIKKLAELYNITNTNNN
ncbi:hypothetical protein M0812_19573 [Anaeramoeba flamelloides]|uniref:PAS domain-containing protein n=1 Tax=Anaeramoeba flamelloides TaxID=1746091 RepID=A0AAV7Z5N9_9EUKA|nr:hypothetical protein M0812_19573 [Anaeramoeba flamelloides]